MVIKLFDIDNGKVVPSVHCFTLSFLKSIMDKYPDSYITIYQYLFYMTCPDPDLNPFFNFKEDDKEEIILKEINADFSPEDDIIQNAINKCKDLYQTPTSRAYIGMKTMLDRLADYMSTTTVTSGRDGNINSLIAAAKNFDSIRSSFKGVYKDLKDEQQSRIRGDAETAYDQKQ